MCRQLRSCKCFGKLVQVSSWLRDSTTIACIYYSTAKHYNEDFLQRETLKIPHKCKVEECYKGCCSFMSAKTILPYNQAEIHWARWLKTERDQGRDLKIGRLRATFKVTMLPHQHQGPNCVIAFKSKKSYLDFYLIRVSRTAIFRSVYLSEAILRCVCLDSSWLANTSVTRS